MTVFNFLGVIRARKISKQFDPPSDVDVRDWVLFVKYSTGARIFEPSNTLSLLFFIQL